MDNTNSDHRGVYNRVGHIHEHKHMGFEALAIFYTLNVPSSKIEEMSLLGLRLNAPMIALDEYEVVNRPYSAKKQTIKGE